MHIVFYQSLFIIPVIPVANLVQGTSAGVRQYLHFNREGPVKHVVYLRKDLAKYRDYTTFHRGVRGVYEICTLLVPVIQGSRSTGTRYIGTK